MLPTILQIGPIAISTLGILTLLGVFLGLFNFWKKGKEEYLDEDKIIDGFLLVGVITIIFSRTFYILKISLIKQVFFINWFDFVNFPGFSWLGTLFGGILSSWFFCRKEKWSFFKIADYASLGVAAGAIFYYFGFFLDGSGLGLTTKLPWGIKLPGLPEPRHPISIYQLLLMLAIYWLINYFEKHYRTFEWYKNRRSESQPGFIFLSFIGLWSLSYFLVAFFKERELYWIGEQIIYVFISIISFSLILLRSGKYTLPKLRLNRLNSKKKVFHYKVGMEAKK